MKYCMQTMTVLSFAFFLSFNADAMHEEELIKAAETVLKDSDRTDEPLYYGLAMITGSMGGLGLATALRFRCGFVRATGIGGGVLGVAAWQPLMYKKLDVSLQHYNELREQHKDTAAALHLRPWYSHPNSVERMFLRNAVEYHRTGIKDKEGWFNIN